MTTPVIKVLQEPEPVVKIISDPEPVVKVLSPGPPGPQGAQGPVGPPGVGGGTYQATVAIPSDTWTITHNLGFVPAVSTYDTDGVQAIGVVVENTVTRTVVEWAFPFSGSISLS